MEQIALISGSVAELQTIIIKQNASILEMRGNEQRYKAEYERMHKEWTSLMRSFENLMLCACAVSALIVVCVYVSEQPV